MNNTEMSNMCIFKIPEEEGSKRFEKILSNNFPKLRKDSKPHIHKAQRTLGKINKHKTQKHLNTSYLNCWILKIKIIIKVARPSPLWKETHIIYIGMKKNYNRVIIRNYAS